VATYRVLTGIDYPPSRRAEPGDVVSDLPARSIKWLREQGHIELVEDAPSRRSATPVAPEPEDED
jgi:hypothetical protein